MTQYLSLIKSKLDAINVIGSTIDATDIISYTFNGLLSRYNALKMSIHNALHPISLNDLYLLLCSEEINVVAETLCEA